MKKLLIVLVVAVLFLSLTGCQEQKSKDSSKWRKPSPSGLEKQADIKLVSMARFLCGDGSWYLTEQKHEISIEPAAIKVTAKEPSGEIISAVQNGQFAVRKGSKAVAADKELFELMTNETICKALLELYVAELKKTQTGSNQTVSLTLEGQVYNLVFSDKNGVEVYKNKATQKNDLVVSQGKRKYILFGYNYLKFAEGRYFPSKIDVYVYNDGSDRKLIAQYDSRLL
ncbi:MAG: hypothetical protein NTW93_02215 [Phycisphaerae bacterium]|nr:hypothetical protein [Phycisphaerae bacterium]